MIEKAMAELLSTNEANISLQEVTLNIVAQDPLNANSLLLSIKDGWARLLSSNGGYKNVQIAILDSQYVDQAIPSFHLKRDVVDVKSLPAVLTAACSKFAFKARRPCACCGSNYAEGRVAWTIARDILNPDIEFTTCAPKDIAKTLVSEGHSSIGMRHIGSDAEKSLYCESCIVIINAVADGLYAEIKIRFEEQRVVKSVKKSKKSASSIGKNKFGNMDYIENKSVFKAVMFARKLMGDGVGPGLANSRAANYYNVSVSDVAKYVGQHASRTKSSRVSGKSKKSWNNKVI